MEAEALAKMPPNVEPLRPRVRPMAVPNLTAARSAPTPQFATAPVRSAMAMPEEVRAEAQIERKPISPIEPLILGGNSEPTEEAEEISIQVPAVARSHTMRETQPEPKPEPKRRRFFGAWSERKPELRTEPVASPRQAQPRATSQVMTRQQPERPAQAAQPELPDLGPQEEFEIPAFLRRQTN
jgi:hypothetical protein